MGPVLSPHQSRQPQLSFLPGNPDKQYHPRLPPRRTLRATFFWRSADRKEHSPFAVPVPFLPVPASLEKHARVTVVTQNVDGLHQRAGSSTVYEVHGSLFETVTLGGRRPRRISRQQMANVVAGLRRVAQGWFPRLRLPLAEGSAQKEDHQQTAGPP